MFFHFLKFKNTLSFFHTFSFPHIFSIFAQFLLFFFTFGIIPQLLANYLNFRNTFSFSSVLSQFLGFLVSQFFFRQISVFTNSLGLIYHTKLINRFFLYESPYSRCHFLTIAQSLFTARSFM